MSYLFSGVVFNEMKGVYSQPDNILGRASQQASFLMACPFLILLYSVFLSELSPFPILFLVAYFHVEWNVWHL